MARFLFIIWTFHRPTLSSEIQRIHHMETMKKKKKMKEEKNEWNQTNDIVNVPGDTFDVEVFEANEIVAIYLIVI